jgi:phospholipid-binding lipoprotein MlaA
MKGFPWRAGVACSLLCLAGCVAVPRDPAALAVYKANNDPLEPLNRKIFAFNLGVDRALIKPLAKCYRRTLPADARDAIRRLLDNLKEPLVVGNCLLQGRLRSAAKAGGRVVVNSTFGIAGLDDVATGWRLPEQTGDFGQTLWTWGFAEGPYLIVPVFGPETPRDGIGQGVDVYLDPLRYIPAHQQFPTAVTAGRAIVDGVDQRTRNLDTLDELQRESIDYYAALRSLYRQNRAAQLGAGKAATTLPPANFYDDPGR